MRVQAVLRLLPLLVVTACVLSLASTSARSDPAQRTTRAFEQPDGTVLRLRLWGDEFANGWETEDGRTVLLDRTTSFWEYAERDDRGALRGTRLRVGRDVPVGERHLRPAGAALDAAYAARGIIRPEVPRLQSRPAWATGAVNVLVIMVQFPADPADPNGPQPAVPATYTASQTYGNLFGADPTGPGNLSDYYTEVSYGALDLVGTVVGPFTVANDKNDYDDGPLTVQNLVTEAVTLADASVDFSAYDNDHDGVVDGVFVCYAGGGADCGVYYGADPITNNLWPHFNSVTGVPVDGGARSVRSYVVCPELLWYGEIRTIGVYAHEFGHVLGLPDLYDTDGTSEGVGEWCLMGSGCWTSNAPGIENGESPAHLSAWCKSWLNWVTPVNLTGGNLVQAIPRAETSAFAVQLVDNLAGPNDWPGGSGEYFLIENRQQSGFDLGLPGCGLLVWHIDESRTNNKNEGHTAATHRLVDLEEADGPPENLDGTPGNRGDTGDPFPGSSSNQFWSDSTTPHSLRYTGAATGIRLKVLGTSCASTMSVQLGDSTDTVADFQAAPFFSLVAGSQPWSLAIGDLNGDGKSDLVSADRSASTVSVLLSDGDGAFGAKTDFATGVNPRCVAIGDVNGDDDLDLAVANSSSNTVSVLLGNGDGTFGAKTDFGTGTTPYSVAIGEFNGDGRPDLVTANYASATVSVLLGNGDGTFGAKSDYGTGSNPRLVAIGDLNGEGNADLAVANSSSNSVSVLFGNGNGTFGAKSDRAMGNSPSSVAIGDLNRDGKPDLAVTNEGSATVSVLLNNGDGTFGTKSDRGTGSSPSSVAIGDLNGDGKRDLVVANYSSNTVSVLPGNGNGGFGVRRDFGTGSRPLSVAIGDLNEDERPDLATADYSSNTISVLLNNCTSATDVAPTLPASPRTFRLLASRPNPSRGASEVRFALPSECVVDVVVFDLAGRRVRSLVTGERSAPGEHGIHWDGRDGSGAPVRDGVYLVRVRAGSDAGVRKLIVLR
jgi:M6 family metalloprotease-like protein